MLVLYLPHVPEKRQDVVRANGQRSVKRSISACLLEAGQPMPGGSMAVLSFVAVLLVPCFSCGRVWSCPVCSVPDVGLPYPFPFPDPLLCLFVPSSPVFLQREPFQQEAITCGLPLCKETPEGLQASASSCTGSRLPAHQAQGKSALGSRDQKAALYYPPGP